VEFDKLKEDLEFRVKELEDECFGSDGSAADRSDNEPADLSSETESITVLNETPLNEEVPQDKQIEILNTNQGT